MEALERVSGIWLVGKMVHDLFEVILALDGVDRSLKVGPSQNTDENLPNKLFGRRGIDLDDSPSFDLQVTEKGIKSLSLTPSLVAHMDAALKSAASPNESGIGLTSSSRGTSSVTPDENCKHGKDIRLTPETEDRGEFVSSGTSYKFPSTPGPAGLNATEWFVECISYV